MTRKKLRFGVKSLFLLHLWRQLWVDSDSAKIGFYISGRYKTGIKGLTMASYI